jgi:hypothetical protein
MKLLRDHAMLCMAFGCQVSKHSMLLAHTCAAQLPPALPSAAINRPPPLTAIECKGSHSRHHTFATAVSELPTGLLPSLLGHLVSSCSAIQVPRSRAATLPATSQAAASEVLGGSGAASSSSSADTQGSGEGGANSAGTSSSDIESKGARQRSAKPGTLPTAPQEYLPHQYQPWRMAGTQLRVLTLHALIAGEVLTTLRALVVAGAASGAGGGPALSFEMLHDCLAPHIQPQALINPPDRCVWRTVDSHQQQERADGQATGAKLLEAHARPNGLQQGATRDEHQEQLDDQQQQQQQDELLAQLLQGARWVLAARAYALLAALHAQDAAAGECECRVPLHWVDLSLIYKAAARDRWQGPGMEVTVAGSQGYPVQRACFVSACHFPRMSLLP